MPIGIRVTDLPAAAGILDDDDEFLTLEDGSLRRATRTQAGPKAAIVQVTDTANQFTGINVETVLAEIQDNVDALVISGGGMSVASEAEALAGTDNTKAMTPLRVRGQFAHHDVRWYGAVGDGTTDDTAAIQAAIDAAAAAGGGTVVLPMGVYAFSGVITVKQYVDLVGSGAGTLEVVSGKTGTKLLATAAGAQLRFGSGNSTNAQGSTSGNFTVDGNSVGGASAPLVLVTYCVGRTFQAINVTRSAGVGMAVHYSQNNAFLSCDSSRNATDGLSLDYGAGGNVFLRFEANNNTGWQCKVDEASGGGTGPYARPTHNKFDHCIFEMFSGQTQGALYVGNAAGVKFDTCVFAVPVGAGNLLDSIVRVNSANATATFEDCIWSSTIATGGSGLTLDAGVTMLRGRNSFTTIATAITLNGGGGAAEELLFSSVTNRWGGSATTSSFQLIASSPVLSKPDAGRNFAYFYRGQRDGETTGFRWQVTNTGTVQWMDGTSFTADTNLYRYTANVLKTDDKFTAVLGLGVGNSVAASSLGTVTRKMEVFDANGVSVGFVPIYNAIT